MTFAPRTWVVGEVVTAALLNQEIRDQFNSMFAAWSTYTPTWTGSTTNPVLNNGTMVGRYMKLGRTVVGHINLTAGSTTTYGAGNYNWTVPSAAANAGASLIGNAHLLGTDRWVGATNISPGASTLAAFFPLSATNVRVDFMTPSRPEALAATAALRLTFAYETAA